MIGTVGGCYASIANIQVVDALDYDDIYSLNNANIIAVKSGNENDERVLSLLEILNSDVVTELILKIMMVYFYLLKINR